MGCNCSRAKRPEPKKTYSSKTPPVIPETRENSVKQEQTAPIQIDELYVGKTIVARPGNWLEITVDPKWTFLDKCALVGLPTIAGNVFKFIVLSTGNDKITFTDGADKLIFDLSVSY